MIKGIVAVDAFDGIGFENDLLFKVKEDMTHFKETTTGHIVVMGKNTFESLKSKPLPNRHNIVLSSTLKLEDYSFDNLTIINNLDDLIDVVKKLDKESDKDIFIMGGGKMYETMEPYINEWIVTIFDKASTKVDTYLEVDFQPFEEYKKKELNDSAKVVYYIRD